ncbi:MAG: precorrin-4 C(11)-methyltransferase [Synergistaceae bacterium]|jgi:precorrin-4/cobalt-precorrin-4 C11-methyltransferase|nr:precorrin-4 C(11)-methyltransferase [Synergistaceae bacterium]
MDARPRVYIVGAGPGDPELMTVKGSRLLAGADVVVYAGSLVNESVLSICRDDCEKLNSIDMTLEEQTDVMTKAALAGKSVVRLHTGDPSLYGAISEQIAALSSGGVGFEIVPGVSSLQAAASRLGIEYTVPDGTQTLICTRVSGRTPVPELEDIERLASHGASLVVFLSAGMAEAVAEKCIAAGMRRDTPAAWIYRATWSDERARVTTLEDLPRSMRESGIHNHALIVVGDCLARDPSSRSFLYSSEFQGARA